MARYKVGSSVSYGTGQYDSQAHGGHGRGQTKLSPTAGKDKGATKGASDSPPVYDKTGSGQKESGKIGYQMDAHTGLHHGKRGQAVGHIDDLHMDFDSQLYSEGRPLAGERQNPGFVADGGHGNPHRAQHHPTPTGAPDKFQKIADGGAHGYRHEGEQKKGYLRMSGHSGAHLIGKRYPQGKR